jgi:MFS family permease
MYGGGRFISFIGSGIQAMALPLYIVDSTGSGTLMGILSMFTLLPMLLMSPFSGVIGDRSNRKNIMIAMDFGRGILVGFLAILVILGKFNLYILFFMQILISVMDSMFNSSSAALMPDLINENELIEANSIKSGLDAAATILGPILGGLIYGIWGIKMVFFINGISFLVSAIFSMLIRYNRKIVNVEKISMKTFVKRNSEVLKFILEKKGLFQLFTFAMCANFLLSPLFDIVMPYVLKREVGFTSQQYGYVMAFLAVGLLLGNVAILTYFKKLGLRKLMRYGFVIETALRVIVCALMLPSIISIYGGGTWTLLITIVIFSMMMEFFNAFVNTAISTNLQNLVPVEMRARFFSILGMFSQGAIPLGTLLFGILLDKMKYYEILIAINVIVIVIVTIFLTKASDEAYEAKI